MIQLLILFFLPNAFAHPTVKLENVDEIRKALGLDQYAFNERLENTKIAIIDNGFLGVEGDKKYLPDSVQTILTYDPEFIKKFGLGDPSYNERSAQTDHGRVMAQIVWAMTGANPRGPKFYLLNANGITNFRRAVRYAIEEKVDLILYSQNRECCGNFDGRGFLNEIVNEALSAGILWVNAAGNYGGNVYNGPVIGGLSEFRIKSNLDENMAQLILTWNSSGSEENTGTDKDLDLYVYDESGKEVAKSVLRQVLKKNELGEGETFLPRERIRFEFSQNKRNYYKAVIKTKTTNFSETDRIRLILIPEKQPIFDKNENQMVGALSLLESTGWGEIMVPADNPGVITVGEIGKNSAQGPTVDGRLKPEVILENSVATFSNGQSSSGTSNAAAYFTGILAVLRSHQPSLTRLDILAFPKKSLSSLEIQKVSLGEFSKVHRKILEAVEELFAESPLLAGRYVDGRYVIGTRKDPVEVLGPRCTRKKEAGLEFYLAFETHTQKTLCFTRRAGKNGSRGDKYPWESQRMGENTRADHHAFVEVRQVFRNMGAAPLLNQGVWLTPSPGQLPK